MMHYNLNVFDFYEKYIIDNWWSWLYWKPYLHGLLEKGYHLIVIDSFVNSSKESLERVKTYLQNKIEFVSEKLKIIEGDIRNELT